MKKLVYVGLFLIMGIGSGIGQVVFQASVSDREVGQYSSIELQFSVNANATDFRPPAIKGLQVVSGPNRSVRQQYINGKGSTSLTYSYTLLANKTGTFQIFPATIKVGGKSYSTDLIEIKVVPAAFESDDAKDKDYYIRLNISDTIAYVGQQIQAYYKLYTTLDIGGMQEVSGPSFDDFFVGEMGANSMGTKREIINGKTFLTRIIKGLYLVPQKSGVYDLEPTIINMEVYPPGSSRGFFRRGGKKVSVHVPGQTITVKSLPEGAPASFSGAVGHFTFKSLVSSTSITTDDALTLSLYINGNGDEQSVTAPKQPTYDLLEAYEATRGQESRTKGTQGIVMSKSYDYNYVPKGPGKVVLTPEFSYFDTDSLRYITLYAHPVEVDIRPGQGKSTTIEDFGNIGAGTSDTSARGSFPWWLLGVGALVVGAGVYFLRRGKNKEELEPVKKNPREIAVNRLKGAKKLLDLKDHDAYYTELSLALNQYLEDKYAVKNDDRSIAHVKEILESQDISDSMIEDCTDIMKRCEMALYARQSDKDMAQLYERTVEFIQGMED